MRRIPVGWWGKTKRTAGDWIRRAFFPVAAVWLVGGMVSLSCFSSPEVCRSCNQPTDAAIGSGGTGGLPLASGGGVGTAGTVGSGGATGTGGMIAAPGGSPGAAGSSAIGGEPGSGGATGGAGGNPTGGATPGSGGSGSGGRGLGGDGATGGRATGTGGAASGGRGADSGGAGGATTSGGTSGRGGAGAAGGMKGSGGAAGGAGGAAPAIDPDLVVWYKFDEATGATATDAAMFGGVARNGTLTAASPGAAAFSTMARVGSHAVSFTGATATAGGYVTIPSLQNIAPAALTIACWVYLTGDLEWQRVFHLGVDAASPVKYMFLTTHQAAANPPSVRFTISTMGSTVRENIEMTSPALLTMNVWHHIAVTLAPGSPYTGTLYIDRVPAGSNTRMTLHAGDLGATDRNFIGKSQFAQDAYLGGAIDDFRIYRRALTAAEIAALPP